MKRRIILISTLVVGAGILGGFVVFPTVKRHLMRKRLEAALTNKDGSFKNLDKLQLDGFFSLGTSTNKATISLVQARERAKQVWENYGWFSSDQPAIVSAFNGLGHAQDVTKMAGEFFALYDENLLTVLKSALSDKTQYNILMSLLSKLPKD